MTEQSSVAPSHRLAGWLVLPFTVLAILIVDQISKHLVDGRLEFWQSAQPIPALGHLFDLTLVANTGAAFGIFPDSGIFFIIVAAIIAVGIVFFFPRIPQDEWLLRISLSMQLGGALGNLIDRIRLGYVVDFMDFHVWPVFNFSDTFIVVGVLLLAYRMIVRTDPFMPTPTPAADAQA